MIFTGQRPNQQCESTEGSQLATDIGFSPTRTTPPCYNMNCRQPPLGQAQYDKNPICWTYKLPRTSCNKSIAQYCNN